MWLIVYAIYLAVVLPVTVLAACAICAIGIPAVYLVTLARVLVTRPAWLPDPQRLPQPGPDPAVLQYFYGPAVTDVVQAARIAYGDSRRRWALSVRTVLRISARHGSYASGAVGLAGATGTIAGALLGALAAAYCTLAHVLVVGLSAGLMRVTGAALEGVRSAVTRTESGGTICAACGQSVLDAVYICPGRGCARRHYDMRPGRFGIWRRRCRCGTMMSILPFPGCARMVPSCPHCYQPVAQDADGEPEIILPVLGASSEAKAQLLLGMAAQLKTWDRQGQLTAVVAEDLAGAYAVRLITDGKARILRLVDAADQELSRPEDIPAAGYSSVVRTFTFLIDPTARQGEWRSEMRRQIESTGVSLQEARLAVVFAGDGQVDAPKGSTTRWARRELGLGELVRSVRREVSESYFFYAAIRDDGMHSPAAPLMRWLLAGDGVSLSPSRVVSNPGDVQERSYRWPRTCVFAATLAISVTPLLILLALR